MQVESPAETVVTWLSQQPLTIQQEIAFLVLCHAPDVERINLFDENPLDTVGQWLSPEGASAPEIASRFICFGSLFEFWLGEDRGTREGWERAHSRVVRVAEVFDGEGHPEYAQHARDMASRHDFRAAMWLRTFESWRQFCEANLRPEVVRRWADTNWRR